MSCGRTRQDESANGHGDACVFFRSQGALRLRVGHNPFQEGASTGNRRAAVAARSSRKTDDRGYGVFIDSARYISFNVGVSVRLAARLKPPVIDRTTGKGWSSSPRSDSIEALVPADGVEVYVVSGPTPMDAVRRFNLLNGGGALPPKWGLGFMTRTWRNSERGESLSTCSDWNPAGTIMPTPRHSSGTRADSRIRRRS